MNDVIADNRRYVRRSLKSRITLVTRADKRHVGTLVDVSKQGIGITSYQPCDPRHIYEFELLKLPERYDEKRMVSVRVECKWVRQISAAHYACGFAIHEASPEASALLETLSNDDELAEIH